MATTQFLPSTPKRYYGGLDAAQSPLPPPQVHRPIFHSPRCQQPDEVPPETLKTHESRWLHMSQQAGCHQQDGSVLVFTRRISPLSLRSGVTPQVAARVRELCLEIDERDDLPEWMDIISALFSQLEHLHLSSSPCDSLDKSRMRRLYVLYRLPDLVSIDGKAVTEIERQLARPSSPNGHRVPREEWVNFSSCTFDSDESDSSEEHGDAIEVSLTGAVKRTPADVPIEDMDESDWQCPLSGIPGPCNVVESSPAKKECYCAGDATSFLGLALPAFETPSLPSDQSGDSSAPGLAAATLVDSQSETGSASTPIKSDRFVDYSTRSSESTPERIIAEATCSTRSLSITSPFTIMFRGDDTLEEILERNKLLSQTPAITRVAEGLDSTSTAQRNVSSAPKVKHARSLSSPFPMQFRKKIEAADKPLFTDCVDTAPKTETAVAEKEACEAADSVETSLEMDGPTPDLKKSQACDSEDGSSPKLLPKTQQGSPKSVRRRRNSPEKKTPARGPATRPPPCPTSSRRVVPNPKTKIGKRFACWRSKKSVRSKSIVDDDDSSTDEEDETEMVVPESPQ